jgi:hypothetical protein
VLDNGERCITEESMRDLLDALGFLEAEAERAAERAQEEREIK